MSFTSTDLIDALRRRMRRSLRPQPDAGEFPPGWAAWFAAMRERADAVTGATAEAIIAIFAAREPAPAARASIALNRWRAFNTLWRQQWHPVERDSRGIRLAASAITLLVHLLFALFLMYLAFVRLMALPPDSAAQPGEDVIEVEFIGDGTPDAQGGGPAQADTRPAPQPTPQPPRPDRRSVAAAAQPPVPSVAAEPQPAPPTPPATAPPVEQPLQVTETPAPDQAFVIPPPPPVALPQPPVSAPDLAVPSRDIQVVDVPAPVQPVQPREVQPRDIATPALAAEPADIAVRDVPAPVAPVQVREVPAAPVAAPTLATPSAPEIARRDIPAPPGPPAPAAPTAPSPAAAAPASSANAPVAATAAQTGTQPEKPAAGSGATPAPTPGALPSPKRGDDWGVSDRNRPGGQAGKPGLFNADGSPRLAGDGKVGGGLPPGTITEDFAKIDRNGTWLKRPPTDYTPTSFDRFWVPNETLLQEWVRRSIKEVLIPIPGTSKTIKCSVVLLALGGACDISDPNMQDVEATARKPPDVPFKPELQEDQDGLRKK